MAPISVQQVLASGDGSKAAELIITLLSEVAAGREIVSTVSEIAQVTEWQHGSPGTRALKSVSGIFLLECPPVLSACALCVVQGVLTSRWPPHVKSLAYELCKAGTLPDADVSFALTGIKVTQAPNRQDRHAAGHSDDAGCAHTRIAHTVMCIVSPISASLQSDLAAGDGELCAQALSLLPCLQPHMLASLLSTGMFMSLENACTHTLQLLAACDET